MTPIDCGVQVVQIETLRSQERTDFVPKGKNLQVFPKEKADIQPRYQDDGRREREGDRMKDRSLKRIKNHGRKVVCPETSRRAEGKRELGEATLKKG